MMDIKFPITADMFESMTGHAPVQDDLERCNCKKAGAIGHWSCGICAKHKLPVFTCQECFSDNASPRLIYTEAKHPESYTFHVSRTCVHSTTVTVDMADVNADETMEDVRDFAYQLALDTCDYEAADEWLTKPELTLIDEDGDPVDVT